MNRAIEEILYIPRWRISQLDIIIGQGPAATSICLELKSFTLIGATTRSGQLSSPLRDRFGIDLKLELYTPEELKTIVERSARLLGIPTDPEGAAEHRLQKSRHAPDRQQASPAY